MRKVNSEKSTVSKLVSHKSLSNIFFICLFFLEIVALLRSFSCSNISELFSSSRKCEVKFQEEKMFLAKPQKTQRKNNSFVGQSMTASLTMVSFAGSKLYFDPNVDDS